MPRVVRVLPKKDYVLQLWFDTGETGFFDVKPLLDGPVFQPLKDPDYFNHVRIDETAGTVAWPNEVDICPDTLYHVATGKGTTDTRGPLRLRGE